MHSLTRPWLVAAALAPLAGGAGAADPAPPKAKAVTPAVRARVGRLALSRPLEAPAMEKVNLAGNVPAWLLSQVHLTPEEELAHARALDKELCARHRTAAAPLARSSGCSPTTATRGPSPAAATARSRAASGRSSSSTACAAGCTRSAP